jgi:hypothetical protein
MNFITKLFAKSSTSSVPTYTEFKNNKHLYTKYYIPSQKKL